MAQICGFNIQTLTLQDSADNSRMSFKLDVTVTASR